MRTKKKTAQNIRPLRGMPSSHGFGTENHFTEGGTTLESSKMGQLGEKNRRELGANVLESERCSHEQQMEDKALVLGKEK